MMIPHRAAKVGHQVAITTINNRRMVINCTAEQYVKGVEDYNSGKLIQEAFGFLNADEREFLVSGLTPQEWNAIFPKE